MDTQTLIAWSGIVGFFLPLLIAAISRLTWPQTLRAVVAFILCLVAGLGTAYFSGSFSLTNIGLSMGVVLVTAWSSFSRFWNKVGVTDAIEKVTNSPLSI